MPSLRHSFSLAASLCAALRSATLLCATLLHASASTADIQIIHSDAQGLRLLVEVDPGVHTGSGPIAAAGLPRGAGPGGVDLPFVAELIATPPGVRLSLIVSSESDTTFSDINLPPADSLSTILPEDGLRRLADAQLLGILRGIPGHALHIYPWQFDPTTRSLRVHTRLLVDVRFDGASSARPHSTTDVAGQALRSAFLNPPSHGGWRAPLPARRAAATRSYDPSRPWVKVSVSEDGVYRITPQWLVSVGVDVEEIDPNSLAMTHVDEPIHITVTGAEDGLFDGADELLFHGRYRRATAPDGDQRDHESEHGPTDTYWLTWGAEPGLRFVAQDVAPVQSFSTRDWYLHTAHFEIDRTFDQLGLAPDSLADRWFWQQERPLEAPYPDRFASQSGFNGDITGFWDDEDYDARVTVALQGITGEGFGEHHTLVKLNGETLEESYWAGQISHVIDTVVPSSVLRPDRNRVLLQGKADRIRVDLIWFNWFRLEFRRRFHAAPGFLDAAVPPAPEGHRITVEGFADEDILLFDVDRGLQLTGGVVDSFSESLFDITFEDAPESAARYVAVDRLSLLTPTGVIDSPSDWRSGAHGFDYVILSHPDLLDAAEKLAKHRRADGLSVAVVSSQDVYDEFSYGRFARDAIAAFADHIYHDWQPRPAYLLILGDETWDYRGIYTGRRHQTLVPTLYYLARRRGYSPSDFHLSLVDGDDLLPDLSIGRLAVDSPAEALTTVDKIIRYDTALPSGPWRSRAIYAANWHAIDEFSGPLDLAAARFTEPLGLQSLRHYAPDESPLPNAIGKGFLDDFNEGALIANFSGHGAAGTMQYLFSTQFSEWDYLSQIQNGGRLPLMLALSCLNGMFVDPRTESLSEHFTELPDGGAIAYISTTAISFTSQNNLLQEGLYTQLFVDGQTRFGPALDVAKIRLLAAHPGWVDDPQGMQLMGDPAQHLALSPGPDYAAVSLETDGTPVVGRTTRVTAVVRNNTRLGPDGPVVTLVGRSQDGVVDTLLRQLRPPFAGTDTVLINWPVTARGEYDLSLVLDADDDIAESDESNNRVDATLSIVEAPVAAPLMPEQGADVTAVRLTALMPVYVDDQDHGERAQFALSTHAAFADSLTRHSPLVAGMAGLAAHSFDQLPVGAGAGDPLFWRVRVTVDGVTSPWSAPRSLRLSATADSLQSWRQQAGALLLGQSESLRLHGDALVVDHEPPAFRPAEPTRDDGFTVLDLPGAGVLATDGRYLYAKRWFNDASKLYGGTDYFARIGTGFGGTFRGRYYGVLADSTTPGISATFHDGYLYSDSGHLFELERIDPETGHLDTVAIADGLLDWTTGQVVSDRERRFGQILHAMITSDGEQIYNVSMSSALGTRVGWGVRVFDVDADGWHLDREFIVPPTETGFTYQWTDGIFADGERLYLIEFAGQRRIRAVSAMDGSFVDEWTSDQDITRVIGGQYDPTNDRVWLGDLEGSGLFRYRRSDGPPAGRLVSPVVGPASAWTSVHVEGTGVELTVEGEREGDWISLVTEPLPVGGVIDLTGVDANQYARFRLVAQIDTAEGAGLHGWTVDFVAASDLEVGDIDFHPDLVRAAIRNRGLMPAPAAAVDLLTRSGRLLATRSVEQLAPGEITIVRFDDPLRGPAERMRVWIRPGAGDGDAANDRADVPFGIPSNEHFLFHTWPQRQPLSHGDAVVAGQAILVEAVGSGRLSVQVDHVASPLDTTWLEATGTRGVLRLQPGKHDVDVRLLSAENVETGSAITLHVVDRLTVSNALVVPNPVGAEGAEFTGYISRPAEISVDIYSLSGRRVRRLQPAFAEAGFVSLSWDGRDQGGGTLAAGSYLFVIRARSEDEVDRKRGVLVVAP